MSKPVVRIFFALLISLVIIAAIATTVQARLGSTSQSTHAAAAQLISGRIDVNQRSALYQQFQNFDPGSGGCDHSAPDD